MEHIRITTERLIKNWQDKICIEREEAIKSGLKTFLTRQEQKHIKHCSLNDSRVTLRVDSSAWLYTLNLKKEQLLKKLNQTLKPKEAVIEISLQLVH